MSGVFVRVRVAEEHYALPVEQVVEVVERGHLTPLPGAPPEVIGIHNLRGQVLPVVDLAAPLGLEARDPARIVIAEAGEGRAGFAVDAVIDVAELPPASERRESPHLRGAVLVEGTLIGVLDVESVLAPLAGGTAT
jgi:purine-binding chemotaxis protein CheW